LLNSVPGEFAVSLDGFNEGAGILFVGHGHALPVMISSR
jgi:hypothetical protein